MTIQSYQRPFVNYSVHKGPYVDYVCSSRGSFAVRLFRCHHTCMHNGYRGGIVQQRREFTRKLHERRLAEGREVDITNDSQMKEAHHSLQLYWLATVPGYREKVKARVSDAAKRADQREKQIYKQMDRYYKDHDYLGREVEGCG